MPILMPQDRVTFRSPPASPVSEAGAAATIALLLGEMNNPWPIPKIASASITAGRLVGAPSSTAKRSASDDADEHARYGQQTGTEAVAERAAERCNRAEHHRDDGKPQPRNKSRVVIGADKDEGQQKEKSEQRRVGQ